MNHVKVPSEGSIRHIVGFGLGDTGYDVLETFSLDNLPNIAYYYIKRGVKQSVSITKFQSRYFVEYDSYSDTDSLIRHQKKSCTLKGVTRDFLMETVKAYRAYRMLFNEYNGFRDDILDALKGLECVYLGGMARDKDRLMNLMERSGFHVESFNFDTITTKEGICLSLNGLCFHADEIIP